MPKIDVEQPQKPRKPGGAPSVAMFALLKLYGLQMADRPSLTMAQFREELTAEYRQVGSAIRADEKRKKDRKEHP